MNKLAISLVIATTLLGGCSLAPQDTLATKYQSDHPVLENTWLLYRPDIQQGNVVTQEMVNQLHLGMSKKQVRYLLGTPLLVDLFHQDEWHYLYSLESPRAPNQQQRISLYFQNDNLQRIEGDLKPDPQGAKAAPTRDKVVVVPDDATGGQSGSFSRAWIGVKGWFE